MKDTTPEFRRLLEQRFLRLEPQERVRMCTEMFDTACELVIASLPAGLDARERRRRLCERLYGSLAQKAFGPSD